LNNFKTDNVVFE